MGSLTIRLQVDAQTGKKNILVSYRSDEDALPMEHEEEHRRLVEQLVEGGLLGAGEAGQVIIEREAAAPAAVEAGEPTPPASEGVKQKG
jgi:hypothetical protein